jgi:RNase H-fold protein (predicted Holliday junction resolvase)
VNSIVGLLEPRVEVGVATSNGKAYYRIASFLRRIRQPFEDIILENKFNDIPPQGQQPISVSPNIKVIITTRKERLLLASPNVVCIEDLGDDISLARERLFSYLYPAKPTDWFVVGIDPGERTGVAAFMNNREVESAVISSFDQTISRVADLLDNAPNMRRVVKIGRGNPRLATRIANELSSKYNDRVKIQLVDERGTSVLSSKRSHKGVTRDQRAARLIAFRDGQEFSSITEDITN